MIISIGSSRRTIAATITGGGNQFRWRQQTLMKLIITGVAVETDHKRW